MASIKKRENGTYLITVSCGYDMNNRQIRRTMTYKPDGKMTPKQIEKEVNRQAVLFEEECQNGLASGGNTKLADFADQWMVYQKKQLRPKTYQRYEGMLKRIKAGLGHLRLDRIQPRHLLAFYDNLSEGGIRLDNKLECKVNLKAYLKKEKLSMGDAARRSALPASSVSALCRGNHCNRETGEKLSVGLQMPLDELFKPLGKDKPLAAKTVLHHHRMISSMLHTAVEWGLLLSNPCDRTKPPRVDKKEPKYLDEVQAAKLLDLLETEREDYRTMIRLLIFTGMRRGELLGLQWSDVDFERKTLQICRTIQYIPERGVYVDETKNTTSNRVIKLSQTAVDDLKRYRAWQTDRQLELGTYWRNTGFIFTNDTGKPIHPDTISSWFSKFIKAHKELPPISIHSLRHTNATLQIAGGVPLTTVAKRLGHADTVTTSRIYAHAIKSADEAAAETLEDILSPDKNRRA